MEITLIVAMADNGAIGQDNQLLWHLPNDFKHFKSITMGKPIVMGRKTFESIGRPLPGRQNIILTRNKDYVQPGCDVVHSVDEAITLAKDAPELMIIGGGEIYRLFLEKATQMQITEVHTTFDASVRFVSFNTKEWREISRTRFSKDERHAFDYSFVTLAKT